ncbi:MAG: LysE family transporter [Pseudomonadota bacterium]
MELFFILGKIGLAQALAVISPGPSFLIVARTSMAESHRAGSMTAIGLGLGSVIWASAALFGLASLFKIAPWIYMAIRIMGGLYLLHLAVQLWRHAKAPLPTVHEYPTGQKAAILRGLLTQLANPKVAVFFGSIFVVMLPPQPPPDLLGVLLVMVFLIEVSWYLLVALLLSNAQMRDVYGRAKAWIDRVAGTFLGMLGIGLIIEE